MIDWLMGWPSGVKLNPELDAFLGELFLWILGVWNEHIIGNLIPFIPTLIMIMGTASMAGGLSLLLAITMDVVRLLTVHIACFYLITARIFHTQLDVLYSLFTLFRGIFKFKFSGLSSIGKKRNVLRNRIDACDYDLDQLLLGTILFTVLTFLLPTVAVYYIYFATVCCFIV